MKDLQNILRRIAELEVVRSPYALATVVGAEGSVYRGLGTRMLIESLGQSEGTINGGCLEGDVREQAMEALQVGQPRIVRYDAFPEDDIVLGTGLGCAGRVCVLIEPVKAGTTPAYIEYLRASALGALSAVLATVVDVDGLEGTQLGQRLAAGGGLPVRDELSHPLLGARVRADVDALLADGAQGMRSFSAVHHYELADGSASVLMEVLRPPLRLVVLGGGYDARPVVRLAAEMGWHVSVVDHRPLYACPERFPEAREVLLAPSGQWPTELTIAENCAAVVMSHNFLQDQAVLHHLLQHDLVYLGVLGPQQRTERLLADLADGDRGARRALFSPVGLDIGAQTPEEIALSIVAEIQAVCGGRGGGSLRLRQGPIHDR